MSKQQWVYCDECDRCNGCGRDICSLAYDKDEQKYKINPQTEVWCLDCYLKVISENV